MSDPQRRPDTTRERVVPLEGEVCLVAAGPYRRRIPGEADADSTTSTTTTDGAIDRDGACQLGADPDGPQRAPAGGGTDP